MTAMPVKKQQQPGIARQKAEKGEFFMSKRKKQLLSAAGGTLIVALTVLICYLVFTKNEDLNLKYDDNATVGIMPGIDLDARRKELQDTLDRSMIAYSINTSPVFLNGTSKGNLLIENPGNNAKLLRVSIKIDSTQEEIYSSEYLKPGTYIDSVALDKVLEKGTYDATAYFLAYDEADGEYIGETGAQITITVQN